MLTAVAPTLASFPAARVLDLVQPVTDARGKAEILLAVTQQAALPDAERLGEAVLTLLRAAPRWPGWPGQLQRVVPYLPGRLLAEAQALSRTVQEAEPRAAVDAAIGVRWCELDQIAPAAQLVPSLGGNWRAEPLFALAHAHLRAGDVASARAVAVDLSDRTWRAEIAARAARLSPLGTVADLVAELQGAAGGLDAVSSVTVLARAAGSAPPDMGAGLCASALAAADDIDDAYQRSMALTAVSEAFLAHGEFDRALETSAAIPHELLRADALAAILNTPATRLHEVAIGQIAELADQPSRASVRVAALRSALRDVHSGPGSQQTLTSLFDAALEDLAEGSRQRLFHDLPLLLEVAAYLDGPESVAAVAADLADIESWWP